MRDELKERLQGLLEEELRVYECLGTLIDDEEGCVRQQNMEGLLAVLQEKQQHISRQEKLLEQWIAVSRSLGVAEGREGPAFWAALSRRVGEQGFRDLVDRVNHIRDLAAALLEKERRVQQELELHLEALRAKLVQMKQGRQALRGYAGTSRG